MVNFNVQDGYSVVTIPKTSSSHHHHHSHQDDDTNLETIPLPLLDSQTFSHHSHQVLPTASSVLLVHEVQFNHAGNYTCAPSNTRPTNINVHVLKGKYTFTATIEYSK